MGRRVFLGQLGAGAAGPLLLRAVGTPWPAAAGSHAPAGVKIAPDQQELDERQVRNQAVQAIRRKAKANGLNLVVVIADTFRLDHWGPTARPAPKPPASTSLPAQGVVFENAFADGLPTIPCRRVYHTGKSVLPGAAWIPHPAGQVNLAQILRPTASGPAWSATSTTTSRPDMNLHMGFDTWQWIRGQERSRTWAVRASSSSPRSTCRRNCGTRSYDRAMRTST